MKYAVLDVETTGLFDFSKPADADGQPRLCALTILPCSDTFEPNDEPEYSVLVKPDGWEVSPDITAINGLTTERCEAEGVPLADVLAEYSRIVADGYVIVAYNAQFDTKVMRGELRRAGLPDLFETTPNICAMRSCQPLSIEKAGAKKGGMPKLSDAYRHFFHSEPPAQHTSRADALSCMAIARELLKIGALKAPDVHYAKNRPEPATKEQTA
jgi:DNA polymerase-3 subunit epsilon